MNSPPLAGGAGGGVDIARFFTPTLPPPSKGEELKVNSIEGCGRGKSKKYADGFLYLR